MSAFAVHNSEHLVTLQQLLQSLLPQVPQLKEELTIVVTNLEQQFRSIQPILELVALRTAESVDKFALVQTWQTEIRETIQRLSGNTQDLTHQIAGMRSDLSSTFRPNRKRRMPKLLPTQTISTKRPSQIPCGSSRPLSRPHT